MATKGIPQAGDNIHRWLDLQKQGFMRMANSMAKPKHQVKAKKEQPIVSCFKCRDWHRKGRHTYQANSWAC